MALSKITNESLSSGLDASKLTGSLPSAMATDTTSIENDISILALQNAITSNMTAHSLSNNYIEQFENSTNLTFSTAIRNSAEYVSCVSVVDGGYWPYTNYADQVFTHSGFADVDYYNNLSTTHTRFSSNTQQIAHAGGGSGYTKHITIDYLSSYEWTKVKIGFDNSYGMIKLWRMEASDNGSTWTVVDQTGSTAGAWTGQSLTNDNNLSPSNDSTGVITNVVNAGNLTSHGGILTLGTAVSSRYLRFSVGQIDANSNSNAYYKAIVPSFNTVTQSAAGSVTSTTITPQDSASKSSLGLVLLYKNASGTNTLNTDIIAKVSANNGTTYSTCVLAAKGTFSTGINIAIAPAIAVTAGTQLKYKVEFANQSAGSNVAQVHGVALQY